MPELPEVETVRVQLEKALVGKEILRAKAFDDWARIPLLFEEEIQGCTVDRVLRHGKYLFLDLGHKYMMAHLGMSGSFRVTSLKDIKVGKHEHYGFRTNTNLIYYNDPRRFGRLDVLQARLLPELKNKHLILSGIDFYSLGPDALNSILIDGESDAAWKLWRQRLQLVSGSWEIKNALISQPIIAGIGNIYASEILFRAKLHPKTQVGNISNYMIQRISKFSSRILRLAIENKGTSFPGANKFEDVDGEFGKHYSQLSVYNREGKPCKACGKKIKRITQQGRSTFYCSRCQAKD